MFLFFKLEVIAKNSEGEVHATASLDVFQHEVRICILSILSPEGFTFYLLLRLINPSRG